MDRNACYILAGIYSSDFQKRTFRAIKHSKFLVQLICAEVTRNLHTPKHCLALGKTTLPAWLKLGSVSAVELYRWTHSLMAASGKRGERVRWKLANRFKNDPFIPGQREIWKYGTGYYATTLSRRRRRNGQ